MMDNNLIYDIGAHSGYDTEFYLRKGFSVIAIEANPFLIPSVEEKRKFCLEPQIFTIINKAISDKTGQTEIMIHEGHDDWGTLKPEWNAKYGNSVKSITVLCTTFDKIIKEYGCPYYCKIDIEGSDILCLSALSKLKERPKYISVELLTYNNIIGKHVNCLELISELINLGYTRFQLVDQSKNYLTKCPYPAREGKYVDYEFNGYCSGLFGKELPDKWVDIKEVILQYIHHYYQTPNCVGGSLNNDGWFDLHATY